MTVKYNVTDASNPTQLYEYWTGANDNAITGELMFDKVVIDGTEVSIADLDAASGQTQFSVGEHTVKYTLKDPTLIGIEEDEQTTKIGVLFVGCYDIASVNIPNSVTSIGEAAFDDCSGLTSVTLGNGITTIGDSAFCFCLLDESSQSAIMAFNPKAINCRG